VQPGGRGRPARRADGPPPPHRVHRVVAGPPFRHLLDGPVGEVDLIFGQEHHLLAVEIDLELVGDQPAGDDVGQAPAAQRLVARDEVQVGFVDLDHDVELVLYVTETYTAEEPHRTPFIGV